MSKLISEKMNAKLNEQVINELFAAHNYLAMAAAFESKGLAILSKRFIQQSDEEHEHAMKFFHYIQDTGGDVTIKALAEPKADYAAPVDIIKAALESELTVTGQINALVGLAEEEKDYATRSFLQWFLDEQVEEVSSMRDLVQLATIARDMLQVEARVRHDMTTKH